MSMVVLQVVGQRRAPAGHLAAGARGPDVVEAGRGRSACSALARLLGGESWTERPDKQ
ncbi:hypothetical protein ACWFQ7_32460 [Streptomyces bacillaris]